MKFNMKTTVPAFAAVACLMTSLVSSSAHADMTSQADNNTNLVDSSLGYFGAQLGAGLLSDGGGSHVGFGFDAGYHLTPEWAVGAFFNHIGRGSISAAESGGLAVDGSVNYYGGELNYFVAQLPGLQVGAKLGLGTNSTTVNDRTNSSTDFYYGPRVAYDYPIGGGVTFGGEGNVLFSTATNSKTATNLLAEFKYWL